MKSSVKNCRGGGVFTWHRDDFRTRGCSLRFPLVALYLLWYHHLEDKKVKELAISLKWLPDQSSGKENSAISQSCPATCSSTPKIVCPEVTGFKQNLSEKSSSWKWTAQLAIIIIALLTLIFLKFVVHVGHCDMDVVWAKCVSHYLCFHPSFQWSEFDAWDFSLGQWV